MAPHLGLEEVLADRRLEHRGVELDAPGRAATDLEEVVGGHG